MIRALKKFKIWSKRKKRRKSSSTPQSIPPLTCCSCYAKPPPPPSAPPLPPWLDFEQQQVGISGSVSFSGNFSSSQQPSLSVTSEVVSEISPLFPPVIYDPQPISYQQYLVPAPVYGVPVTPVAPKRAAGFLGCAAKIGSCLVRCFCPCILVRS